MLVKNLVGSNKNVGLLAYFANSFSVNSPRSEILNATNNRGDSKKNAS